MKIDDLFSFCSDPEAESLRMIQESVRRAEELYKVDYSASKLINYQLVSEVFEQKFNSLCKKYSATVGEEEQENISWDDFQETKNRAEVHRFIKKLGFVIPERTFQRHAERGVILKSGAGFFTKLLTIRYVNLPKNIKYIKPGNKLDISRKSLTVNYEKNGYETEKEKYRAKNEKLKYLRASKKVGSRPEFYLEMAARLAVLDNLMRSFGEHFSPEIIAICGGSQDKREDVSALWLEKFDMAMREFSRPLNFNVMFNNE